MGLTTAFSMPPTPRSLSSSSRPILPLSSPTLVGVNRTRRSWLPAAAQLGSRVRNVLTTVKEASEHPPTSSELGAATRISKHRLLMGAINREVLFAQRIIRMFDIYFSMVRRSAA